MPEEAGSRGADADAVCVEDVGGDFGQGGYQGGYQPAGAANRSSAITALTNGRQLAGRLNLGAVPSWWTLRSAMSAAARSARTAARSQSPHQASWSSRIGTQNGPLDFDRDYPSRQMPVISAI